MKQMTNSSAIILLALLLGSITSIADSADPEWPLNTEALLFLWENSRALNAVQDETSGRYRQFRGQLRDRAWYGPHFEMRLARGAFRPDGVDDAILKNCRAAQELGLELVFRPETLAAYEARIIDFANEDEPANFSISQRGRSVVLDLATAQSSSEPLTIKLFDLESADRWHHLIISCQPGRLLALADGKQVHSSESIKGNFNWRPAKLLFGDAVGGGNDWAGSLEGIVIHSRFIPIDEANKRHALYATRLRDRRRPEQVLVQAKLLEKVAPRPIEEMGSYRRSLVEHAYEVVNVLKGALDSKRIVVAHWAVMDMKKVGSERDIGLTYRLTLEPWEQHPQLDSELIETFVSNADLPVFLDVEMNRE